MNVITFTNKNSEIVTMTEASVVDLLVAWANSGEAMSASDMDCINNVKSNFETSFKLRELVFAAMNKVELGSAAWERLFAIA